MTKIEEKLNLFKAYQEALTKFLKCQMSNLSFKDIDYVADLNERVLVAIGFLERLKEIEDKTNQIEKEILENGNNKKASK